MDYVNWSSEDVSFIDTFIDDLFKIKFIFLTILGNFHNILKWI